MDDREPTGNPEIYDYDPDYKLKAICKALDKVSNPKTTVLANIMFEAQRQKIDDSD